MHSELHQKYLRFSSFCSVFFLCFSLWIVSLRTKWNAWRFTEIKQLSRVWFHGVSRGWTIDLFVCRVGKHQDGRAGTTDSHRAQLCPPSPALHPTGAALWRPSVGKTLPRKNVPPLHPITKQHNESPPDPCFLRFVLLFIYAHQGLGLLINLVEYSSRNRHCLVDMEYTVDDTCLEDSLMQPADPTQTETAAAAAQSAGTEGDEEDVLKPSGALAALVKVETATKC